MYPIMLELGPFSISSYGVLNAVAYFACIAYLIKYRARINIEKETLWDILFIVAIGAILGGKIMFFILERSSLGATFVEQVKNFFLNFRYGFVFFGGFLLSMSALIIFLKRKKLPVWKTADFLIPALPLGHAIGRVGCFLVGCCYGREWHGMLSVVFTDTRSLVEPALLGVPVFPVQLFEAGVNIVIFFVLHFLYNKKRHTGAVLCGYGVLYGLSRFCLEYFRGDYRGDYMLGISPGQYIGLGIALAAVVFYFTQVRRGVYDK